MYIFIFSTMPDRNIPPSEKNWARYGQSLY